MGLTCKPWEAKWRSTMVKLQNELDEAAGKKKNRTVKKKVVPEVKDEKNGRKGRR